MNSSLVEAKLWNKVMHALPWHTEVPDNVLTLVLL